MRSAKIFGAPAGSSSGGVEDDSGIRGRPGLFFFFLVAVGRLDFALDGLGLAGFPLAGSGFAFEVFPWAAGGFAFDLAGRLFLDVFCVAVFFAGADFAALAGRERAFVSLRLICFFIISGPSA